MAIDTSIKKGYNQTDLSVIPEDWEMQSLEGIADPKASICYGIVQVGSFASNGIPVLAIKNLNTDYFTNVHRSSPAIEALYVRSRVCPGDVLISVKGTIGRIGIVPQHFVGNISRDLARLRLTERNVPEFWFQMLQSESAQRRLGLATVGTTRMELSIGILKQIRMLCPPKVEQCAIARVLNDVDALIECLDKLIAKKRDIKQATMQQLLTGKTRLPGFSGEWDVKRLGEIAEINMGRTPSRRNQAYWGRGYKWLSIADLKSKYIFETKEEITTLATSDMTIISKGTLVMSFKLTIGKVAFTSCDMYSNEAICSFTKLRADAEYLYYILGQTDFSLYGKQAVKGYTLNTDSLRSVEIPYPMIHEQQAIATILSDMDAEIAALEQKRDKIRVLKQGMMQELLTGKTRLL